MVGAQEKEYPQPIQRQPWAATLLRTAGKPREPFDTPWAQARRGANEGAALLQGPRLFVMNREAAQKKLA